MIKVFKDNVLNNARATTTLTIPVVRSLADVGNYGGQMGQIVYSQSDDAFYGHSGNNWILLSGGGSGGSSIWELNGNGAFIQNTSESGVSFGFNNLVFGVGDTETSGTRTLFIGNSLAPDSGAFRAGITTGNQWSQANRGTASAAFGRNNVAAASESSVLAGFQNTINSTSTSGAIVCGAYNTLTNSYASAIIGGILNKITSTTCAITACSNCNISEGSVFSCINACSGDNSIQDASYWGVINGCSTGNTIIGSNNSGINSCISYNIINNSSNSIIDGCNSGNSIQSGCASCAIRGCTSANTITAYCNNSTIDGCDGNNTITFNARSCIISGSFASNTITGSQYSQITQAKQYNGISGCSMSSIIGGENNNINGSTMCVLVNGNENTITGSQNCGILCSTSTNSITETCAACVIGAAGTGNYITSNCNWSVIIGGDNNTISTGGNNAIIACTNRNTISNNVYSGLIGGCNDNNIITAGSYYSAIIACSTRNTITDSTPAMIIGCGDNNTVSSSNVCAIINSATDNVITDNCKQSLLIGCENGNIIDNSSYNSVLLGCGNNNTIMQSTQCAIIGNGSVNTISVSNGSSLISCGSTNTISDGTACVMLGAESGNIINEDSVSCFIIGGISNLIPYCNHSFILNGVSNTLDEETNSSAIVCCTGTTLGQNETLNTGGLRVGTDSKASPNGGVQFQSIVQINGTDYQCEFPDHTIIFTGPGGDLILPATPVTGQRYYILATDDTSRLIRSGGGVTVIDSFNTITPAPNITFPIIYSGGIKYAVTAYWTGSVWIIF